MRSRQAPYCIRDRSSTNSIPPTAFKKRQSPKRNQRYLKPVSHAPVTRQSCFVIGHQLSYVRLLVLVPLFGQQPGSLWRPQLQLTLKGHRVPIELLAYGHDRIPQSSASRTRTDREEEERLETHPPSPTLSATSGSTTRPSSSKTFSSSNTASIVARKIYTLASARWFPGHFLRPNPKFPTG